MEQLESEVSELQNEFNNLVKEYVICERSHYGRAKKIVTSMEKNRVKAFEVGEWDGPLQDISKYVRDALKKEGLTESQIHNAIKYLQPEHKRPYEKGDSPISESEFEDDVESVFDKTEEFADRILSDKQLDKLGNAERKEVLEQEIGRRKSRKTIDNDRIKHLQEYAEKSGIKLVDKVTKQLPPEQFRGQSEVSNLLYQNAREHEIISDMFKDLAQQVINFKPDTETQKKALEQLEDHMNKAFLPFAKVTLEWCQGIKTILRNITDEKYSETNSKWMQMAEDKFLAYGNHGSGEVNAVLTNKVILKLGFEEVKDEDGILIKTIPVLVKVNVIREETREELGDKTTFKLTDKTNQMFITCPECKLEFNKPIVSDEERDLIAGDLFHQAKTTLLHNGLSNAIDALANNIVVEHVKDPIEWFKEEMNRRYKRDPTPEELKDLKIKEDTQKIKDVDINPRDITEKRHGMLRNIATRRLEKAEHFSKEA